MFICIYFAYLKGLVISLLYFIMHQFKISDCLFFSSWKSSKTMTLEDADECFAAAKHVSQLVNQTSLELVTWKCIAPNAKTYIIQHPRTKMVSFCSQTLTIFDWILLQLLDASCYCYFFSRFTTSIISVSFEWPLAQDNTWVCPKKLRLICCLCTHGFLAYNLLLWFKPIWTCNPGLWCPWSFT